MKNYISENFSKRDQKESNQSKQRRERACLWTRSQDGKLELQLHNPIQIKYRGKRQEKVEFD